MGQDETTQVSRVHTHVLGLNASLDTSDIRVYIPTSVNLAYMSTP